jgi:hypothetical protein
MLGYTLKLINVIIIYTNFLELFDMKDELMRGKYKIPFYSTKTNPNLMVDELKNIKSIANTLLFLRISYT